MIMGKVEEEHSGAGRERGAGTGLFKKDRKCHLTLSVGEGRTSAVVLWKKKGGVMTKAPAFLVALVWRV
jgi:hypothetical protein